MTSDIAAGLLPEGLRDRLPPQAEAAATLLRGLIDHVAAHGYERVQPPLVEYEDGLAGRLAGASRQELLRFVDPVSQRTLALRSDMTGQVGRIASTRLAHYARPLRLAYGGPVVVGDLVRGDAVEEGSEGPPLVAVSRERGQHGEQNLLGDVVRRLVRAVRPSEAGTAVPDQRGTHLGEELSDGLAVTGDGPAHQSPAVVLCRDDRTASRRRYRGDDRQVGRAVGRGLHGGSHRGVRA